MVSARSVQGVDQGFPLEPGPRPSGQTRALSRSAIPGNGVTGTTLLPKHRGGEPRPRESKHPGSIPFTTSLAGRLQGPLSRPEGSFWRALKDMDRRSFVCSGWGPTGVGSHPGHVHQLHLQKIRRSSWGEMPLWVHGQSHPIRTTWTDGYEIGRAHV